jgi:sigma-E factor negative regulatory protein RseA
MDTNNMTQEQISALADGELSDAQVDTALAALRQPAGRAAWDAYHQIGDVLRSDEMAVSLSPNFAARMAARLEAEPTIIAPAALTPQEREAANDSTSDKKSIKRFALPGMVAAAVAALGLAAAPQLMVAMKGDSPADKARTMVASQSHSGAVTHASVVQGGESQRVAHSSQEGVILRDPRIDEYLLAHQRFSPSVYSTAQFARSATFATDPATDSNNK